MFKNNVEAVSFSWFIDFGQITTAGHDYKLWSASGSRENKKISTGRYHQYVIIVQNSNRLMEKCYKSYVEQSHFEYEFCSDRNLQRDISLANENTLNLSFNHINSHTTARTS